MDFIIDIILQIKKKIFILGKLGDRVLMAVCGQKKKGIIVGMRQQQLHGIPKYDTNNVVFVEVNEHPLIIIIQFTQKTGYLLSLITCNFFKLLSTC